MKKLLMVLVCVMILVPSAEAWRRGSGFNQGTLHMDKNMISGDATTGLYFDPDNDGTVEITFDADGKVSIGYDAGDGNFNVINSGAGVDNVIRQDLYSTGASSSNYHTTRRSMSATAGALAETTSGAFIGQSTWEGVNSSSAFHQGANYSIVQNGAAGATHVPVDWTFETSSSTARNTNQLVLQTDGSVNTYGCNLKVLKSTVTLDTGDAETSVSLTPSGVILSAAIRVSTAIAGIDSADHHIQLGVNGTSDKYIDVAQGGAQTSIDVNKKGTYTFDPTDGVEAAAVVLTITGGADSIPTSGAVEIEIVYMGTTDLDDV